MNIIEQLKTWLRPQSSLPRKSEQSPLRVALDEGQRAKWAEDYPRALEALNRAMGLAQSAGDGTAVAVIAHVLAEVYTRMSRWDEADGLLKSVHHKALATGQKIQLAYSLNAMGVLAQAQGDWAGARSYYEQGLDAAREGRVVGAEGRALGFLADTYLHEGNASYAVHLLREALTHMNMTGDIELSSYFVGRLGEALVASGGDSEGRQLLDRALRLARQIGYRMHERLWSVVLGRRAAAEGQNAEAYAHLVRVLTLSDENVNSPERAEVLCLLSRVSLSMNEVNEAQEHARAALEVSRALGDSALLAQAEGALGMALLAARQPAEAVPHLEAAAAAFAPLAGGVSSLTAVELLRTLAAARAESGDVEAAAVTYQQAAEQAQSAGAKLEAAQARRDLGLLLARHGRMAEAVREWSAALAVYEAANQPAQMARLLCDMAAARKYLGQGQRAARDYEEALMLLSSVNDDWETRGLVLSNAANNSVDRGDVESAEAFFNEAIAIARRLGDDTAEATRRGNYGWYLLSTDKPQQAIAVLESALRQSQSLGLRLQVAIQTDNLGLAHDHLSQFPKALEYHRQALDLAHVLDVPHWQNRFKINLAETLLSLDELAEARELLETALADGRASEDVEVVIRGLIGLSRAAVKDDQPDKATASLEEAVGLARRADMRRPLAEALSLYSQQQAALGQMERSAALWTEAQRLFHVLHSPQAELKPVWLNASIEIPDSGRR